MRGNSGIGRGDCQKVNNKRKKNKYEWEENRAKKHKVNTNRKQNKHGRKDMKKEQIR